MRRALGYLFISAGLLAGALWLPPHPSQSHPFCEHDICELEQSEDQWRGVCRDVSYYATNCMMYGALCRMENCDNPE